MVRGKVLVQLRRVLRLLTWNITWLWNDRSLTSKKWYEHASAFVANRRESGDSNGQTAV